MLALKLKNNLHKHKQMRLLVLLITYSLALTTFGQSIDVKTEKFKGINKLTVKAFNGCCSNKGYKAIYNFDKEGNAIKSSNYFGRKHLASFVYKYADNGLLIEEVQTYDINNKNRVDTTRYIYNYDSVGRIISEIEYFGPWQNIKTFSDFDSNNNAQTVIRTFDKITTKTKRMFDSQSRMILVQNFKNNILVFQEEIRYNGNNDIIYSYIPSYIDKETGKMVVLIGGNRYSVTETYEYKYDYKNRWIEKYVIFEKKKILLEKREYK